MHINLSSAYKSHDKDDTWEASYNFAFNNNNWSVYFFSDIILDSLKTYLTGNDNNHNLSFKNSLITELTKFYVMVSMNNNSFCKSDLNIIHLT